MIVVYLDLLGWAASTVGLACLLTEMSFPFRKISLVLNIGLASAVAARLVVTREFRRANGVSWTFDKRLLPMCPRWLRLSAGTISVYGLITSAIVLTRAFSMVSGDMADETFDLASRRLFTGVFSALMVCYAIEFLVSYVEIHVHQAKIDHDE